MKNRTIYLFLVCCLIAVPLSGVADENKVKIGSITYLLSDNSTWDLRGDLMRFGLTPRGTRDFTFADDVLISGDLTVTGTQTYTGGADFSGDLTLENDEILSNSTDAVISFTFDDDAVEVGDFQFRSSNTSGEDDNYLRNSYWLVDDGGVSTEHAFMNVYMDDETSGTSDGTIEWGVVTADTIVGELKLDGAALYPTADDGLDIGTGGNEFGALFLDGIATIDGLRVDDALTDIGGGSYSRAGGDNDLGVAGDFEVVGIAEFDSEIVMVKKVIGVSSPTLTIDVSGATWIEFNTDANQTGHTLTNGVIGVIYTISMGSGSNTARFDDDGVNMALGGNITLTEGHGDLIQLLCVATDDYSLVADRSGN